MRVLFVAGSIPPEWCGVGDTTALLARAMAKQPGVEAGILIARGEMPDARVTIVRTKDWSLWRSLAILVRIHRWRPDVVHFQYPTEGYRGQGAPWLLPLLCRMTGLRVVMTWHEDRPRFHPAEVFNAMLPGGVVVARPELPRGFSRLGRLLTSFKTFRYIAIGSTLPVAELDDEQRSAMRARFSGGRLIAYFGFAYPHKRIEDLFEIADPATDVLILVCSLDPRYEYQRRILELAASERWKGRCFVTGPLAADEAANLLAAADAVVMPFAGGAGPWNSSLRGARMQGTFTLTTALDRRGYDANENSYYALPQDLADMRDALQRYAGTRRPAAVAEAREEWLTMARAHLDFYRDLGLT